MIPQDGSAFNPPPCGLGTTSSALTLTVTRDSCVARYCKDNALSCTCPDSLDWLTN